MQVAPRIRINAVYELTARVEHRDNEQTLVFSINDKRKERAREDIERALSNAKSLLQFMNMPLTKEHMTLNGLCTRANQFGICTKNVLTREELTTLLKARIGTECSICQEEFQPEEWLLKTNCNHCFHDGCLEKWIETQLNHNHSIEMGTCPLCIAPLDKCSETPKKPPRKSMRERVALRTQAHPYSR